FEQLLEFFVRDQPAEQVVARPDGENEEADQEALAPLVLRHRELHDATPASLTIASSRSRRAAADFAFASVGKSPTAVGPEPVRKASGAPAARSASSAAP